MPSVGLWRWYGFGFNGMPPQMLNTVRKTNEFLEYLWISLIQIEVELNLHFIEGS
jgi:hypothetical protein